MPITRASSSLSLPVFGYGLANRVIDAAKSSAFISASQKSEKGSEKSWQGGLFDLAVKDNIATLHLPTTCASQILGIEYRSPFEADVVSRIQQQRAASFKLMGKTNMDEFGMGSHSMNSAFGRVIKGDNRGMVDAGGALRDLGTAKAFSPGGSSGGSAVATDLGFCHIALGTDTGGSVRLPAAYVGIVGFKPSYGLVSRWGVIPYANSLDTVGFMAGSVAPVRLAFKRSGAYDPRDPTSLSNKDRARIGFVVPESANTTNTSVPNDDKLNDHTLQGVTIGYPLEYNIAELDPQVGKAWKETLRALQSKGATVVPVSLPNTKHALSAYYVLAPAEAASNLSKYDGVRYGSRGVNTSDGSGDVLYSEARKLGFGPEVQNRILLGSYTLSSTAIDNYFIKAQKVRRLVQRDFDRIFKASNELLPPQQFDISDLHESIPLHDKLGPAQVDFIVCPTAPTPPPLIKDLEKQTSIDSYMNDVFTVPASLAGLPAISIPFGAKNPRSTIGIQIIGQFGSDLEVLDLAEQLERIWHQIRSQNLAAQLGHLKKRSLKQASKDHQELEAKFKDRFRIRYHSAGLSIRNHFVGGNELEAESEGSRLRDQQIVKMNLDAWEILMEKTAEAWKRDSEVDIAEAERLKKERLGPSPSLNDLSKKFQKKG